MVVHILTVHQTIQFHQSIPNEDILVYFNKVDTYLTSDSKTTSKSNKPDNAMCMGYTLVAQSQRESEPTSAVSCSQS